MGCRQCLPLSVVQLKWKHCQNTHCCNGVVDMFGQWPTPPYWYFGGSLVPCLFSDICEFIKIWLWYLANVQIFLSLRFRPIVKKAVSIIHWIILGAEFVVTFSSRSCSLALKSSWKSHQMSPFWPRARSRGLVFVFLFFLFFFCHFSISKLKLEIFSFYYFLFTNWNIFLFLIGIFSFFFLIGIYSFFRIGIFSFF